MGTPIWPDDPHRTKRSRKFALHEVSWAQAEARWQCATCSGVIASNDDLYCPSCKLYWADAKNGLFDHYDP
jgi:rubrerythrin